MIFQKLNLLTIKQQLRVVLNHSPLLFALFLALLDVIKYQGFVEKHIGVPAVIVALFFACLQLVIGLIFKLKLNNQLSSWLLLCLMPLSMILATGLYALEKFGLVFPNYFFATFSIDLRGIVILSIVFLCFGLVIAKPKFWEENYQTFHFSFTLTFLLGAWFLYLSQPLTYLSLIREDGPIEFLEALAFALASFLAWQLSRRMPLYFHQAAKQAKIAQVLLLLASLALALIVGEKLSWGQRIFGFATPENIELINRQGETNLHNLESVWPLVYWSYLILGLLGSTLWIGRLSLANFLQKHQSLKQ